MRRLFPLNVTPRRQVHLILWRAGFGAVSFVIQNYSLGHFDLFIDMRTRVAEKNLDQDIML